MFKGKLPDAVLASLLETLPLEFSIVDANDKVLAWNRHETRIFRRNRQRAGARCARLSPGQESRKSGGHHFGNEEGTRQSAEFWIDMTLGDAPQPEKILIQYFALRDPSGAYLGCLECSQKITRIQSLKGQQRLMD